MAMELRPMKRRNTPSHPRLLLVILVYFVRNWARITLLSDGMTGRTKKKFEKGTELGLQLVFDLSTE
jgi:hypothetical protein